MFNHIANDLPVTTKELREFFFISQLGPVVFPGMYYLTFGDCQCGSQQCKTKGHYWLMKYELRLLGETRATHVQWLSNS